MPQAVLRRSFKTMGLLLALLWLVPPSSAQFYHDPRRKVPIGFSVDLPVPASKLADAVSRVVESGSIQGSHIYRGDPDVEDAVAAKSSEAFADAPAPGAGQVFYKVRTKALTPDHFPGSNDMGTITVRYIVTPVNDQRSRLRIDAVFVEDAERVHCYSDGSVEMGEYASIMDQIRGAMPTSRVHATPAEVNTADKSAGLRYDLAQEQAMLTDAQAAEDKLQKQLKQLEFDTQGRIKADGIPLKTDPYDHSSTILRLKKGQVVTVLSTSKFWYRVRTDTGEEGWIYYLFLVPMS
ncbi:MAG TPA: SH3 domain-containing protein [Verrucomicrobiae bacterium]|nr:SH3 domain-containing protein [Verrucomicrobiae bacterium]